MWPSTWFAIFVVRGHCWFVFTLVFISPSSLHQIFYPLSLRWYHCRLYLKAVAPDVQNFVLLHAGFHDVSVGPVLKLIKVHLDVMLLHLCHSCHYNTSKSQADQLSLYHTEVCHGLEISHVLKCVLT